MPRVPLNMPKMSMTMEFGTVVEWLVGVGDRLRDGDAVVVVTTDKVDMEVEATVEGVLSEIIAGEGDQVPVGQPIAYLEAEAEDFLGDLFAPPPQDSTATTTPASDVPATPSSTPADGSQAGGAGSAGAVPATGEPVRAVPLARRIAAEAELDLATVTPTGPARTIRARDVREAIAGRAQDAPSPVVPQPAPLPALPVPAMAERPAAASAPSSEPGKLLGDDRARRLRVATARVMTASAAVPQFTVYRTLDLGRMARAREASLKGVGWTTILLRAYALVLREYPALNGFWAGEGVQGNDAIGIALAVDTPRGLLAPVLADPDRVSVRELDRSLRAVAEAVKRGDMDPALFGTATGTVSNLGGMGVDRFNALLTPPQATALSLGSVGRRPTIDAEGEPGVQIACEVGLTVDHRVADGADAARALAAMQAFLADPVLLLA